MTYLFGQLPFISRSVQQWKRDLDSIYIIVPSAHFLQFGTFFSCPFLTLPHLVSFQIAQLSLMAVLI